MFNAAAAAAIGASSGPIMQYRPPPAPAATVTLHGTVNHGQQNAPNLVKRQINLPRLSRANDENFLKLLTEFKEACSSLGYTNGPSRFDNFRLCLDVPLRDDWDAILSGIHGRTLMTFEQAINLLIQNVLDEFAFGVQLGYLNRAKIPPDMTVREASARLRTIARHMTLLPGAPLEPADDMTLKNWLFQAVPSDWQITFGRTGHQLPDENFSFHDLMSFFSRQENLDKLQKQRQSLQQRRFHPYGSPPRGRGGGRGGRGSPGRGSYGQDRKPPQSSPPSIPANAKPGDKCPIHPQGYHTWGECRRNPANQKADTPKDSKQYRKRPGDAHHMEDDDAEDPPMAEESPDQANEDQEVEDYDEDVHWLDSLDDF